MKAPDTKQFKNRSSATDVLRAIGVPTRDYNLFIEPVGELFACKISLAKQHVETLAKQTAVSDAKINKAVENIAKQLSGVASDAAAAAVTQAAQKVIATTHDAVPPFGGFPNFPTAPRLERTVVRDGRKQKSKSATTSEKNPSLKKVPNTPRTEKRTVSSVARGLIVAGKTNDEVWAALKSEFKLDDSKKSYPAWYRRECKTKGLIK